MKKFYLAFLLLFLGSMAHASTPELKRWAQWRGDASTGQLYDLTGHGFNLYYYAEEDPLPGNPSSPTPPTGDRWLFSADENYNGQGLQVKPDAWPVGVSGTVSLYVSGTAGSNSFPGGSLIYWDNEGLDDHGVNRTGYFYLYYMTVDDIPYLHVAFTDTDEDEEDLTFDTQTIDSTAHKITVSWGPDGIQSKVDDVVDTGASSADVPDFSRPAYNGGSAEFRIGDDFGNGGTDFLLLIGDVTISVSTFDEFAGAPVGHNVAQYVYDVSVNGGEVGPHSMTLVSGHAVPLGAWLLDCWFGAPDIPFEGGATSSFLMGSAYEDALWQGNWTDGEISNGSITPASINYHHLVGEEAMVPWHKAGDWGPDDIAPAMHIYGEPLTRGKMSYFISYAYHTPPPGPALTAPVLSLINSDPSGIVYLKWTAVTGSAKTYVYRNGTKIQTVNGPLLQARTINNPLNQAISFYVTSVDSEDAESVPSNTVIVTITP